MLFRSATKNITGFLEDQFSSSASGAPTLKDLVQTLASDPDPGEQILYQVFVPTGVQLKALNNVTLPGGVVAKAGNDVIGVTYTIAAKTATGAGNLENFSLVADSNRAGTFTLKLTPVAREVDGSQALGAEQSANLVVTPVADTPLLQAPSAVRGATDTAIGLPLLAALRDLDGSETLAVKVSGMTATQKNALTFSVPGASLPAMQDFGGGDWGFVTSDAAVISKLGGLTLTSTADFRGANAVHLNVGVTATETLNGDLARSSAIIDVVTIKPIETPVIAAMTDPSAHVQTSAVIPLTVSLANAPAGYGLSVLVQGVPDKAFFTKDRKSTRLNSSHT